MENYDNEIPAGLEFSFKEIIILISVIIVGLSLVAYWGEIMALVAKIPVPAVLAIVASVVTIWLMRRQLRLQKGKVKKEFPHDGLEGLFKGFTAIAIGEVGFFLAVGVIVVLTLPLWEEILSLIARKPILTSSIVLGIAIIVWRVRVQNKKERQERRYANKVLEGKGLEPLKE